MSASTYLKRLVLVLALALLAPTRPVLACPNCKDAIAEQEGQSNGFKSGFSYSVLVMLAVPFGLLGAGTLYVARAVKRGTLPEL
jgi:hypothetical protein